MIHDSRLIQLLVHGSRLSQKRRSRARKTKNQELCFKVAWCQNGLIYLYLKSIQMFQHYACIANVDDNKFCQTKQIQCKGW